MQSVSLSQFFQSMEQYQYFVIDRTVFNLHLKKELKFNEKSIFFIDNPEESKSLFYYETAINYFLEAGIKRKDSLVCIGGGATTDFGGFVASTILRGINWISVPTTLLAMVDASIGGKVGLNTKQGKNQIGSFHLPKSEIICEEFLKTLPLEQIKSGRGEILKYYFLDSDIKDLIKENATQSILIKACIEYKKQVVASDLKESGQREKLNFGHTFGHAFEKCLKLEHGIAVALGIYLNLLCFSPEFIEDFHEVTKLFSLELPKEKVEWNQFSQYLRHDKKNIESGKINFIILTSKNYKVESISVDDLKNKLIDLGIYADYFN